MSLVLRRIPRAPLNSPGQTLIYDQRATPHPGEEAIPVSAMISLWSNALIIGKRSPHHRKEKPRTQEGKSSVHGDVETLASHPDSDIGSCRDTHVDSEIRVQKYRAE